MERSKTTPHKLGLALSGGGYRAAAFHLGTMRKLNQMGVLDKTDVLSTVSGGSIIGAYYALNKDNFNTFDKELTARLKQSIIKKVLSSPTFILICIGALIFLAGLIYFLFFTCYAWVSFVLLFAGIYFVIKYQFEIFPVSKIIEGIYDDFFFNKEVLKNLPEQKPIVAINSTNLQTGRQFTFSQSRMGDSTYTNTEAKFFPDNFPVARAVMASSSVPFAFTPVVVGKEFYKTAKGDGYVKPILVDGGVYDNQGIHKLTHPSNPPRYENFYECSTVITSDAGNKMPLEGSFNNLLTLLFRCMDLFMNRIKMFQIMQNIYLNTTVAKREIAYISLGWDLDRCITGFVANLRSGNIIDAVIKAHHINVNDTDAEIINQLQKEVNYDAIIKQALTPAQLKIARDVGTNLTALSDEQIYCLAKHAELQTELQVRLYCPLIGKDPLPEKKT